MGYRWTGTTWELLGEVVGGEKQQQQQKDITVSVELGSQQFPLSFNRTDDARQVANAFCTLHRLPGEMVQQVQAYVTQLQRS